MKLKLLILVTYLILSEGRALSSAHEPAAVFALSLSRDPAVRLEQVYLHEFTMTIMETTRSYAIIAGRAPDLYMNLLQKFDRCHALLASSQQRHTELLTITAADRIDRTAYFEHLLMLSLALAHMNRKLYELGNERVALQKDFMSSVTGKGEVQNRLKAFDDRIAVLDDKMNAVFAADPANMLLTIKVGQKKQPFYQKIVADYYHLLSMGVVGPQLIAAIRESNHLMLESAWEKVTARNRKFLHLAWQHTCGERRLRGLLSPHKFAALGFYIKHRGLVTRVASLLTDQEDDTLLELQQEVDSYFKERIAPEHFHSSASSFSRLIWMTASLEPRV